MGRNIVKGDTCMDAIWQGLSGIFEVVLIAGLGFFLAKKG